MSNTTNSKHKGDKSEAAVLAALLRINKIILIPWGDNQRYDLAIDEGKGKISRIQTKTGRIINGALYAETSSFTTTGFRKYLKDEVEYIAIYSPELNKCYLVPVDKVGWAITLRIDPPKSKQKKRILWARDFEIDFQCSSLA